MSDGPMSEFEQASALVLNDDGQQFNATIPDGWQQGKGAFGGLVIGILSRALVTAQLDPTRRLRSLNADIPAPAQPGPAIVKVQELRRGGTITFLDAQLVQNGAVVTRAAASFAAPRRGVAAPNMKMDPPSRMPPWNDVPIVPVGEGIGPRFGRKYEYRSTGPLPFTADKEPIVSGWIRERAPHPSVLDEAAIMGLLDAYWPTSFSIESTPRGVATIGFTMELLMDPRTLPPAEPLFYRARGVTATDNFFVEMRELWSGDQVVALNQQTFTVLS